MSARFLALSAFSVMLGACSMPPVSDGDSSSSAQLSSSAAARFVARECQVSGCSAQICQSADEEPMASDCMYRPVYECYATARCEVQANGSCSWTMTQELSACLLNPPKAE